MMNRAIMVTTILMKIDMMTLLPGATLRVPHVDNLNIVIDHGGDETDDHGNDDPDEGWQEARPP